MAMSCSMLDSPCEFGFPAFASETDSFTMDYVTFQKTSVLSCNLTSNLSNPYVQVGRVFGFPTQ